MIKGHVVDSNGFIQFLPVSAEFYLVFFPGFEQVDLDYCSLLDFTGFSGFSPGFTVFYKCFTEFYWVLLGLT